MPVAGHPDHSTPNTTTDGPPKQDAPQAPDDGHTPGARPRWPAQGDHPDGQEAATTRRPVATPNPHVLPTIHVRTTRLLPATTIPGSA